MTAAPDRSATVESLLLDQLADAGLADPIADLVFAALGDDDDLDAALQGAGYTRPEPAATATAPPDAVGTYVKAIVVEGFRGIGAEAAVRLQPGPGLTLVTGRNGSGKSSFAEAAELALTGESKRWSGRPAVWREGWRNIHQPNPARITVELAVDGQPGTSKVVSEWLPEASLGEATTYVQAAGKPRQPANALGWDIPLELYRPFLSYAELGALVDGKPSEMYDALQAILGLDQLLTAESRMTAARKELEATSKTAKQQINALLSMLGAHPDERARQAEAALAGRRWDLAALEALAVGDDAAGDPASALRQVLAISLPDTEGVEQAVARLVAAEEAVRQVAGTPAGDARRVALLLSTALDHHSDHPGEPCPVCAGRSLDDAWAAGARTEMTRLTGLAQEADAAHAARERALQQLRSTIAPMPRIFESDLGDDANPQAARDSWQAWSALAASDVERLVTGAVSAHHEVSEAVQSLKQEAGAAIERRGVAWQPVATELAAWVSQARASEQAAVRLKAVKAALEWLKDAGQLVRDQRLAPFAALSATVWEKLRQESNIELGPIRLEGASTRRRVALDVTIDGVAGAALGVMSQGELHALGLALFLPRATAQDSPFRFLMIDDPVQSMDPAKVDGLARVLADLALTRQVIVFSHDDRLPDAVRRQQLPATIWEVVRNEQSVVVLKKNDDPVTRYLDDARALAQADELPHDVRAVVVAGFCRSAIEAACHDAVRTKRLNKGDSHAAVERALSEAQTLHQMMALALFDDVARGGDVLARLHSGFGAEAVTAFKVAKSGTHEAYQGDLMSLVRATEKMAKRVQP